MGNSGAVIDYIRNRIFGAIDIHSKSYAYLKKTQWSEDFERLMRNRLIIGAIRYGLLNDSHKPKWDRISSINKRIDLYSETGNDEYLVDVANLCLLEFEEGIHPNKHLKSVDDGHHVTEGN